ncbi:MAG: glycosyltransferase [Alphaproteobacteria bacterium]|nr:glycosyltransferase [Alphaproteobacteria bacterium]
MAPLDVAAVACAVISLVGSAYALISISAARRFLAAPRQAPGARPPVTILKPLHGGEPRLLDNLRSFCTQDYPSVQIVFGVARADDPAIAAVEALKSTLPDADITLVVDGRRHGANGKINNLINMLPAAKHDILVLADSDMAAGPGYLDAIVADLQADADGVVTCLYVARPIANIWARLGAMHVSHGFLPAVLVGRMLGAAPGCFGATIALRRATLNAVGGFEAFRDVLAEDNAMGAAVRQRGGAICLSPEIVTTTVAESGFRSLIRHELRWMRTIRTIAPAGLAGTAVTYPVAWALLTMLAAGITSLSAAILAIALAARFLVSWTIDRVFGLEGSPYWLVPVRDVLSFGVLIAAFCGNRVAWRDQEFGVGPDGRLTLQG